MSSIIRPAYSKWPRYNRALRDAVEGLTDEQLTLKPSPERWPMWATIGHLCCQRVSALCGFMGEPGADSTPFPDALYRCPGDEYLEPAMGSRELIHAIDSTFAIVERCLDTWTFESLDEVVTRDFGDPEPWIGSRGSEIQGSFAHDLYHVAEVNEILSQYDLPLVALWG